MTTSIQPRVKARLQLCSKGKQLRHEWAGSMNDLAHRMHGAYSPTLDDQWQKVMGKGFLPFARHVAKCEVCKAYQENKRSPL